MLKRTWTLLAVIIFFILVIGAYFGFNALNRNFHVVISKQVYRSAQPYRGALFRDLKDYHITAIINMRGKDANAAWYEHEASFAKHHGIKLYNVNVPAHGLPSVKMLQYLVHVQQTSPKPYLIHCLAGVNRTGLASAIAVILSGDPSIDDWQDQLSWQYNLLSDTSIGYQVMQNYLHWLKTKHKKESKAVFLEWVHGLKSLKHYKGWFIT